jgi:hypothetical protein
MLDKLITLVFLYDFHVVTLKLSVYILPEYRTMIALYWQAAPRLFHHARLMGRRLTMQHRLTSIMTAC